MKALVLIGLVLTAIGIAGVVSGGISYVKNRERLDLGIAKIEVAEKETLAIHPAIGGIVLLAGVLTTVAGLKKRP